jgi:hypothetical protein
MKPKAKPRSAWEREPWARRRLPMYESEAWQSLTYVELWVLERLELEHMRQGGTANGNRIVSWEQFLAYMRRTNRGSLNAAIKNLGRLGFLIVVEHGKWNGGGGRERASRYRLTYLPTPDGKPPTDDWRQMVTPVSLWNSNTNVPTEGGTSDTGVTTGSVAPVPLPSRYLSIKARQAVRGDDR